MSCKYVAECFVADEVCNIEQPGCHVFKLHAEIEQLRSENAVLLRQRAPEHRSELDDLEIVQAAKDIEATAKRNLKQALTAADALKIE